MEAVIMTENLRETTLELLRHRPATLELQRISEDAKLPLPWLKSFSRGTIQDPGVNRVQVLYEYLTGKKLLGAE